LPRAPSQIPAGGFPAVGSSRRLTQSRTRRSEGFPEQFDLTDLCDAPPGPARQVGPPCRFHALRRWHVEALDQLGGTFTARAARLFIGAAHFATTTALRLRDMAGGACCCRASCCGASLTVGGNRVILLLPRWGRTGFDLEDAPEAACRGWFVGLVNNRTES
jgi:hypothetical protein